MSRLAFENFDKMRDALLKMTHASEKDIVVIPAPSFSGARVTKHNWFVLAFHSYFQDALYKWYDSASADSKEAIGQSVLVRTSLDEDISETSEFNLRVTVASYMKLLEFFEKTFHSVRFGARLTKGLSLVFENTNTAAANQRILAEAKAMGDDPLLTRCFAVVRLWFIPVRTMNLENAEDMPRPDVSYMQPVDGRACLCHREDAKNIPLPAMAVAKMVGVDPNKLPPTLAPTPAEKAAELAVSGPGKMCGATVDGAAKTHAQHHSGGHLRFGAGTSM